MDPSTQLQSVSRYYGETLTSSTDLKTSACCPTDSLSQQHQQILQKLHPEVTSRFYGCGSPIPSHLTSCSVLDLGCGTGRDVYLTSPLVGPKGHVIGVDMTESQLAVARAHQSYHATKLLNSTQSNVEFRKGYIEDLTSAAIQSNSMDVVISNCVCNLSPDKSAVFSEVSRVLRNGGEFYFSDVYADRRLSPAARTNETLVAECLGGALYTEDFRTNMDQIGLIDIRVVSVAPVELMEAEEELKKLVEGVRFFSVTTRAFKVHGLEKGREDFGQVAAYKGQGEFKFDVDYVFSKGVEKRIDGNTAKILQMSRFRDLFDVTEPGPHLGAFKMYERRDIAGGELFDSFRTPFKAMKSSSDEKLTKKTENGNGCCPAPKINSTDKMTSSGCSPSVAVNGTKKVNEIAKTTNGCNPTKSRGCGNEESSCC